VNRRTFGCSVSAAIAAAACGVDKANPLDVALVDRPSQQPLIGPSSWPAEVAGIRLPPGAFNLLAIRTLVDSSPPFLVNHAARTFYFGALLGRARKLRVNHELLFLACALHDLGLTGRYAGPLPFEIQGATAARKLLQSAGMEARSIEIVWDAIAMHPSAISQFKPPEILLVADGAGADVIGSDIESLDAKVVAEVIAAFPRLDFKMQFVSCCAGVVERFPKGASRTFMCDIGERHVSAFHPGNICDAIDKSPFQE
jgi:hypothetical protein